MIEATCGACGKSISAAPKYAGHRVKCPACGGVMAIPGLFQEAPGPAATPQAAPPQPVAGPFAPSGLATPTIDPFSSVPPQPAPGPAVRGQRRARAPATAAPGAPRWLIPGMAAGMAALLIAVIALALGGSDPQPDAPPAKPVAPVVAESGPAAPAPTSVPAPMPAVQPAAVAAQEADPIAAVIAPPLPPPAPVAPVPRLNAHPLVAYLPAQDPLPATSSRTLIAITRGRVVRLPASASYYVLIRLSKPLPASDLEQMLPLEISLPTGNPAAISLIGYAAAHKNPEQVSGFEDAIFEAFQDLPRTRQQQDIVALAFSVPFEHATSEGVLRSPLLALGRTVTWPQVALEIPNSTRYRPRSEEIAGARPAPVATGPQARPETIPCTVIPVPIEPGEAVGSGARDEWAILAADRRSVAVFLPDEGRFADRIQIPVEDALLACGGDRLLAYIPRTQAFTVHALRDGSRIGSYANRLPMTPLALAMGSAVGERCWIIGRGTGADGRTLIMAAFMQLSDGGALGAPWLIERDTHYFDEPREVRLQAMADLSWIAGSQAGSSSGGLFRWGPNRNGIWEVFCRHDGSAITYPMPGGGFLGGGGSIHGPMGERLPWPDDRTRSKPRILSPISGNGLVLGVEADSALASIIDPSTRRNLCEIGVLPVKPTESGGEWKLIHHYSASGHLCCVDAAARQLHHAVKPLETLVKARGRPYLFCSSGSARAAVRGERWDHDLQMKSSTPATCTLVKAPPGMAVENGVLAWQVPARWSMPLEVLVEIRTADETRLHEVAVALHRRVDALHTESVVYIDGMDEAMDFVPLPAYPCGMHVADEGRIAICALAGEQGLVVVDAVAGRQLAHIPVPRQVSPIVAGGKKLLTAFLHAEKRLDVHDLTSGAKVNSFPNPLPEAISGMILADDDRSLFAFAGRQLAEISLEDGKVRRATGWDHGGPECGHGNLAWVTASSDMQRLACGGRADQTTSRHLFIRKGDGYTINTLHEGKGVLFPLDSGLVGDDANWSDIFEATFRYIVKEETAVSTPALRPVHGARIFSGTTASSVYLYGPGRSEPIGKWADIPRGKGDNYGSAPSDQAIPAVDRAVLSKKHGIGFIIPYQAKGIIVRSYARGSLGGDRAPVIINLPTQMHLVQGRRWSLQLAFDDGTVPKVMRLAQAPAGMTVDKDGLLAWTPPANWASAEKMAIEVGDGVGPVATSTAILLPQPIILAERDTWTSGAAGIAALGGGAQVFADPSSRQVVIHRGKILTCLDASTLRPAGDREAGDLNVGELRGDELLVAGPGVLEAFRLPSLQPAGSWKIPATSVSSIAAHPGKRLCYVAGIDPTTTNQVQRHRVLVVNQSTNAVQWLDEAYATHIDLAGDGNKLFAVLSVDITDEQMFIGIYGQLGTVRRTASATLLARYGLNGSTAKLEELHENLSNWFAHLSVSPDGRLVSPVCGGGFRAGTPEQNGNTIPAFSAMAFSKVEAVYRVEKGQGWMAHHPRAAVVAAGGHDSILLFELASGKPRGEDLFPATSLARVHRAWFAAQGNHLIVHGDHPSHGPVLLTVDPGLAPGERRDSGTGSAVAEAGPADDRKNTGAVAPGTGGFTKVHAARVDRADLEGLIGAPNREPQSFRVTAERVNPAVVLLASDDGTGTGAFIGKGYILTCSHVVPAGNQPLRATFKNSAGKERTLEARVIARHDARDLALLRIGTLDELPRVILARPREIQMGEDVAIIGHPGLGEQILANTMTVGIVSNPQRDLEGLRFIQTSAAVNPGVSGGPMLDECGNVIGVVTLKASIEGVGFAVPLADVRGFLDLCCR